MTVYFDSDKLSKICGELMKNVYGCCCQSSVTIGETPAHVIRLQVLSIKEADEEDQRLVNSNSCILEE